MPLDQVGPEQFTAFARKYQGWKSSGFDSLVTRLSAFFRWAVEMEYIDRYRPGPSFQRPAKQAIRDDRIKRRRSFSPVEVSKLYQAAGETMKCWIALGLCAAFTNSDVAHLTRSVVDLSTGIIDFRRRKTGLVRRVIPLPQEVANLLKLYKRPEGGNSDRFFLTRRGREFDRTRQSNGKPTSNISRMFGKIVKATGIKECSDGRNFAGLRTSFYNLAPRDGYDTERAIIMGHAHGRIDLDHYLEDVGIERLRHVVQFVWSQINISPGDSASQIQASPTESPSPTPTASP